ncbi:MAG: protein translocase subunit SecF [Candidatus Woesearchaeota archaeon]
MTKRAEKRLKLKKRQFEKNSFDQPIQEKSNDGADSISDSSSNSLKRKYKNPFLNFYYENYKLLLILPILLLILSIIQISYQAAVNDGDFINKDISLKGGVTITIPTEEAIDIFSFQEQLSNLGYFVNIRTLQSGGRQIAILIESDIDISDEGSLDNLINAVSSFYPLVEGEYSVEGIGASIGQAFFRQAILALLVSFIIMALIVAITFKTFVPSLAVIASALSDIVITVAILNIMGFTFSTAGLAALLMIIGYSVDIDILLSTRVLKRKEGSVFQRIGSAFKTGILMNFTTLIVLVAALILTTSEVITQIMTVLIVGLLVDQMSTWIQNVGILRLYLDSKSKKKESSNES